MILQALFNLYERYPEGTLPPVGYDDVPIAFKIVVDLNGNFVDLLDIRENQGKTKRIPRYRLPARVDRTGKNSWQTAFLLWDHARYVLGLPAEDTKKERSLAIKRVKSFINRIKKSFPEPVTDDAIAAVIMFYEKNGLDQVKFHRNYKALVESKSNLAFQLAGDIELVAQRPAVIEKVRQESISNANGKTMVCLVTGQNVPPSRLHPATPIYHSQSTAKIHSFNIPSSESYGKCQGFNAPVSELAVFRYTTALNYLLRKDSDQMLRIGDTTIVIWAEKANELESALTDIFGEPSEDDPKRGMRAIVKLYEAVKTGKFSIENQENRFLVLGLSPNVARISIRFWDTVTAIDLAKRICLHFEDLRICRGPNEP